MTSEDSLSTHFQLTAALFPEWVEYFAEQDPYFDASSFLLSPDQSYWNNQHTIPLDASRGMTLRDSIFFEFAPDSTKFVDINAYAAVVEEGGMKRIAFDVDAAVRVGDISRGVSYQIDHSGAQYGFVEAKWVDNDRILIIGHDFVDHFPDCVPFFKLYDLERQLTTRFRARRHYPCKRHLYIRDLDKRMERLGVTRY